VTFQWKHTDETDETLVTASTNSFEPLVDIPITKVEPPPPASIVQPRIKEVANEEEVKQEIKINLDIEVNEKTVMTEFTYQPIVPTVEPEDTDVVFSIIEKGAALEGGLASFYKSLGENLKYPLSLPCARERKVVCLLNLS
jgi:protein TonB